MINKLYNNIELITIIATIIFFSIIEIYFNADSAYGISKDIYQATLYGIGTILALWVSEKYVKKLVIPMIVFLLLFNFMANLNRYGSHIKDMTLEEVQTEFCKTRNWKPCQVQPTPKFEDEYPRIISWDEVKPLKWSWTAFQNYNRNIPRLKKLWEEKKANYDKSILAIENDNREFLALSPKKYSQFSKMAESFSSLSTVETFWLLLRLVFGFFISIILVALFENLNRVMIPISIEYKKVDSVEVEAIQKMALLKTDRHWRYRDPKNIMKNFPTFPINEGLKIIYEVRNATLPQKPAKTRKVNVAGMCGSFAGETPTSDSNVVIFRKKQA